MKTALLLIACWLLALIPLDQGLTPLAVLLFHPDRELYGAAQLTGFGGILLTLYLANLGVEVVLRRRFQIAGMLALLALITLVIKSVAEWRNEHALKAAAELPPERPVSSEMTLQPASGKR